MVNFLKNTFWGSSLFAVSDSFKQHILGKMDADGNIERVGLLPAGLTWWGRVFGGSFSSSMLIRASKRPLARDIFLFVLHEFLDHAISHCPFDDFVEVGRVLHAGLRRGFAQDPIQHRFETNLHRNGALLIGVHVHAGISFVADEIG